MSGSDSSARRVIFLANTENIRGPLGYSAAAGRPLDASPLSTCHVLPPLRVIPPSGIKSEIMSKNKRVERLIKAWASVYVVAGHGLRGVPHFRARRVSVLCGLDDVPRRSPAIARVVIFGVKRSPIAV